MRRGDAWGRELKLALGTLREQITALEARLASEDV
jgi:hypothetical protein